MRPALLLGTTLLLAAPAAAQQADTTGAFPDSAHVARDAAAALDNMERSASGAEQLAERIATLAEQPLDVNVASASELVQIPALSPFVAKRIVQRREKHGPFASLGALRAVRGVTADVFAQARPYLTVGSNGSDTARRYPASPSFGEILRGIQFSAMQRVTRRLDLGEGYDPPTVRSVTAGGDTIFATRYRGGPERIYTRLRARYERRVSLALTLDKDPGERFAWAPERQSFGYDHVSGHVALRDFGRLKTLVAGDFTAEFGQGLTLRGSGLLGKGRNAVGTVVRSGGGLDPYGSAGENRFFRGLAATVRLTPHLQASAFASRRTLDASLVEADTSLLGPDPPGTARVTTLTESGLHRTPNELSKKDALGETLFGGALQYDGDAFRVGMAGYRARFDEPIQPDTARLFRRFDFSGRRATAASVFGQVFAGNNYLFFGEIGRAPGGTVGGIGGVLAEVGRFAEAVMLARHFPRDFTSLHGSAFGERSGPPQNETGLYTGLRLKPARRVTVKGYFDLYRFPWVRFAVPRPSSGYDARLVAEHEPRDWLSYYVQLRTETREGGTDLLDPAGRALGGLVEETRQSARLHVDYEFSDALRLRSRIEGVRYVEGGPHFADEGFGARSGTDYGALLYQDVRWRPFERLRLDARLAFFDTDSYAARVYAYENDLLYAFSVPALSGQGRRFYMLARYAPSEHVILEAKYAATHFRGVETVGSGLTETDGPRRREIRAQVRVKF